MKLHHHSTGLKITLVCSAASALLASLAAQTSVPASPSGLYAAAGTPTTPPSPRTGTGAAPEIGATASAASAMINQDDREFIARAALAGHEEVALSQIALSRATNPAVRSFAQMIVNDHQAAHSRLMALAGAKGVKLTGLMSLPGALGTTARADGATGGSYGAGSEPLPGNVGSNATTKDGDQGAMSSASEAESTEIIRNGLAKCRSKQENLADKKDADFDEAYLELMADNHEDAIDLYRSATKRNDADRQLSAFANDTLPQLQAHEQQAESLKKALR